MPSCFGRVAKRREGRGAARRLGRRRRRSPRRRGRGLIPSVDRSREGLSARLVGLRHLPRLLGHRVELGRQIARVADGHGIAALVREPVLGPPDRVLKLLGELLARGVAARGGCVELPAERNQQGRQLIAFGGGDLSAAARLRVVGRRGQSDLLAEGADALELARDGLGEGGAGEDDGSEREKRAGERRESAGSGKHGVP